MVSEIWRPVVGYPGYLVSDRGRVRSIDRYDGRGWRIKGRLLRLRVGSKGYLTASLWRSGRGRNRPAHRLVLEAFVGPCPTEMETRHLNGVPSDNRLVNLAWGTRRANAMDKKRHGTAGRARPAHCKWGHSLTDPANLTVRSKCRTCQRRRTREYMARKRSTDRTEEYAS